MYRRVSKGHLGLSRVTRSQSFQEVTGRDSGLFSRTSPERHCTDFSSKTVYTEEGVGDGGGLRRGELSKFLEVTRGP